MKKQLPYSIPEGYSLDLQQRLETIPSRAEGPGSAAAASSRKASSSWQKVSPYLALAAVFAVAFVLGSLLRNTVPASPTSEEIAAYYIDSDLSLAQLEEAFFYSED